MYGQRLHKYNLLKDLAFYYILSIGIKFTSLPFDLVKIYGFKWGVVKHIDQKLFIFEVRSPHRIRHCICKSYFLLHHRYYSLKR